MNILKESDFRKEIKSAPGRARQITPNADARIFSVSVNPGKADTPPKNPAPLPRALPLTPVLSFLSPTFLCFGNTNANVTRQINTRQQPHPSPAFFAFFKGPVDFFADFVYTDIGQEHYTAFSKLCQ